MNICVSNLPQNISSDRLEDLFKIYGDVKSVKIMNDVVTGKSIGVGFVSMDDNAGKTAIEFLNRQDCNGKVLNVYEVQLTKFQPFKGKTPFSGMNNLFKNLN